MEPLPIIYLRHIRTMGAFRGRARLSTEHKWPYRAHSGPIFTPITEMVQIFILSQVTTRPQVAT